jgi:hypothetical protein
MNRALVTFAVGEPFEELLDLALPGMAAYAIRHGYDVVTDPPRMLTRPPSWGKVTRLLQLLDEYDELLWIDCDVLVLDDTRDLADEMTPDAWHGITLHRTVEGDVPSCGVWLVRQPMQPVLEAIWRLDRYCFHPWWEQAALHDLLGYGGRPVDRIKDTELYERTCWLDVRWNALRLQYPQGPEDDDARMVHVGPGSPPSVRAQMMRRILERSVTRV